jgi:hypothetical protein
MTPRLICAAVIGACLLALLPATAGARPRWESSYCSPTGDYCDGVYVERTRHFRFTTFSLRGRMRVCVRAPSRKVDCRRFRLRYIGHALYEVDVRWRKHFPYRGRGRYTVRFSQGMFRAPALHFRAR